MRSILKLIKKLLNLFKLIKEKESFKCNIILQLIIICSSFMKFHETAILINVILMFTRALSLR